MIRARKIQPTQTTEPTPAKHPLLITLDPTSTEGNKKQCTSAPHNAVQANADDHWAYKTTETGIYTEYWNDFFAKQPNNIQNQYSASIKSFEQMFK
jgi:hypothetical protein